MKKIIKKQLIVIVGPTAVGKTRLAISLAKMLDTEIVSADSRQFYREMTIGTAKPEEEELQTVPHHFINSLSINQVYSAGDFEKDCLKLLEHLFETHNAIILVGGSGLFIQAVTTGFDQMPEIDPEIRKNLNIELESKGLSTLIASLKEKDPEYYGVVDLKNPQRVIRALEVIEATGRPYSAYRQNFKAADRPFQTIKIGLDLDRDMLYDRINKRMDLMIANGLFEEAGQLFPFREFNALQTVGYQEIFGYLLGEYDREEAIRLLKRNSRHYAKRQLTWFRKDEKITWFSPMQEHEILEFVKKQLEA